MEKKQIILLLIEVFCIFFFLFFIGSGIVSSPIYGDINVIDEGQFGAWVSHMLRGEHLYKDTYAAYGPLYIYPSYVLSKLFGPSLFLIRIVYIVCSVFFALVIVRLLMHTLRIRYPLQIFTVLLLLIIPGVGMRQGIGLLTILLCFIAVKGMRFRWFIAAGLSLGCSFLISTEIGIFSTVICGLLFFIELIAAKKPLIILRRFALFIFSLVFLLSLFFHWADREGWFFYYFSSTLDDLVTYSGINLPIGKNFPNALVLIPQSWSIIKWVKYIVSKELLLYWIYFFYIITFCFLFIRTVLRKAKGDDLLIFLISLYGLLLSMILIGRSGHFSFTLAPVFIIVAFFLNQLMPLLSHGRSRYEKFFMIFFTAILILFSVRIASIYYPHFPKVLLLPSAIMSDKNNPKYVGPIFISAPQAKSFFTIQNFIEKNTLPTDAVFFIGNEPVMYLIVNRSNPARFDIPEVASIKEKRLEIVNNLTRDKTKYIIDDSQAWSADEVSNWQRLPEVRSYILKNYTPRRLENFTIYERDAEK
ncbi:MAG: hypothetical protein Q8Q49_06380 [bacterium]|nr:hypothetical protein [bacterium]